MGDDIAEKESQHEQYFLLLFIYMNNLQTKYWSRVPSFAKMNLT